MFHIVRNAHHSHYTCISNAVIMDKRLSLAARGFFAVVLSLNDRWDFSISGMAKLVGVNKETVLRYIRELEKLGYVKIESQDKSGRYIRKGYTFFESGVTENTSLQVEVTENTAPKNTATVNSVTENTAQSSNNTANNNTEQNTMLINQAERQEDFSFLEKQVNADGLRAEYGIDFIGKTLDIIRDCMKAKSRTISGENVDNAELRRVFGAVCEEDIHRAVCAVRGKQYDNFTAYFGSVLFNQIRDRLDNAQSQIIGSSFVVDEVMDMFIAKYRD